MAAYKSVDLYGGAIRADLPTNFGDVSDIRQVPDTQEVFLDKDGFTSIVFDILERVGEEENCKTDLEALKYHLEDIVEDDTEGTQVWETNSAFLQKLPNTTTNPIQSYTLLATQQHQSPPTQTSTATSKPPKPTPDFTAITILLIRLEAHKTDIVISINVPHSPGEYDPADVNLEAAKKGALIERALAHRERILQTFEIREWGLFV
ncbi:hypothetical protein AAFC00_004147 [Neodothiora populina]|uniref:Mog1p/PsbP-like protein n=1 Tax=Neodothiora populina TaxID=2781224 RepID=A0ABR3PIP4_9PEZI